VLFDIDIFLLLLLFLTLLNLFFLPLRNPVFHKQARLEPTIVKQLFGGDFGDLSVFSIFLSTFLLKKTPKQTQNL